MHKYLRPVVRLHVICTGIALALMLIAARVIPCPASWEIRGTGPVFWETGGALAGALFLVGAVVLFVLHPGRDRFLTAVLMGSAGLSGLIFLMMLLVSIGSS